MITDSRLRVLEQQIALGERMLRELQRRRVRDHKANDQYYRLKAALTRRKRQLKSFDGRPSR